MAYIGQEPTNLVASAPSVSTYTGDNSTTSFTLTHAVDSDRAAALEVFVSNVQQQPDVAYTLSGTTITFTSAPGTDEPIYVIYRDHTSVPIGALVDDIVTTNKIFDGAVTSDKLNTTGVSASTYGGSSQIPVISVSSDGRITSAANTSLTLGTIATQDSSSVNITGGCITGLTCLTGSGAGLTDLSVGNKFTYGENINAGDFVALDSTVCKVYKVTGSACTNVGIGSATCWFGSCCCNCSDTNRGASFITTTDGTSIGYGTIFTSNCFCIDTGSQCYALNMIRACIPNWCETGYTCFNPASYVWTCTNLFGYTSCCSASRAEHAAFNPASCKLFVLLDQCCCCNGATIRGGLVCFDSTSPSANVLGASYQTITCCWGTYTIYQNASSLKYTNTGWLVKLGAGGGTGPFMTTLNVRPDCITAGSNWCIMTPSNCNGDNLPGSCNAPYLQGASCGGFLWNPNESQHNQIPYVSLSCAPGPAGGGWTCVTTPCYCHGSGCVGSITLIQSSISCICANGAQVCQAAGPFANAAVVTSGFLCGLCRAYYIGYDCAQANVFFIYHDAPISCNCGNARISFYCSCTNNTTVFKCQEYPGGASNLIWEQICFPYTVKAIAAGNTVVCCTLCCAIAQYFKCALNSGHCGGVCGNNVRPTSNTCNTIITDIPTPSGTCTGSVVSFVPCNGVLCNIIVCATNCNYQCKFGLTCNFNDGVYDSKMRAARCGNVVVYHTCCSSFQSSTQGAVPYCSDTENITLTIDPQTNALCMIGIASATATCGACCKVHTPGENVSGLFCCLTPGCCVAPNLDSCNWQARRITNWCGPVYLGVYGCASAARLPIATSNNTVYVRT